jgi:hypothetical protein
MSDNRGLPPTLAQSEYNAQVAAINYLYSTTHNYDFIYYQPYFGSSKEPGPYNCVDPNSPNEFRHPAWSKLLSTLDILSAPYDYVVYIDSDCIFKDFSTRIEDFFGDSLTNNILFFNNTPWEADKPCSGFYICKNDSLTRSYIRKWYRYYMPEKNKSHAYEQSALWMIFEKWKSCKIIEGCMFNEHPDQFLRHVCSLESDLRKTYFKQFIVDHGISYESIVASIPVKQLNTASIRMGASSSYYRHMARKRMMQAAKLIKSVNFIKP